MPVQARLTRLVLVTCLLGVAAAAVAAWFVYDKQSRATEQSLAQSAQAVAQLIDNELLGTAETLRVLAGTTALQRNDLPDFYETALRAADGPETTVVLLRPDGQQVLNTRRPLGDPLHLAHASLRALRHAAGPDATVVSNLFVSTLSRQPEFAVQVPVYQQGHLSYYLNRGLPAASMRALLMRQAFPDSWRLAVVDRLGVIVARSTGQEEFVGRMASEPLLHKLRTQQSGTNDGTTLDGIPVRAFFHRAPWSQWTVILSVPAAELNAPARAAAELLAGLIALLLIGALLAARHVARQIAAPVTQLHLAAQNLGRGEPVSYRAAGLAEIDAAGAALVAAAGSIARSQGELEARVTEAIARTEQAQQALQRAQKLEALGRLTGGVAHDFNNVLQTLTSALDLIKRDPDPRRHARHVEICEQAIARATALVAQLRSFGRVQDAVLRVVDLAQALEAATPLFRNAVGKHALLSVVCGEGLGHALIDPVQFDMALLNLVINARDAVPEGGRIEVRATRDAAGHITFAVRDNGAGMPPEVVARASEPFFTTKESGMGLGLAQVFAFARQSGGTAEITSAAGQGTCVALRLPGHHPATPPPAPGADDDAMTLTVLLVDDDALIRDTTGATLRHLGWQVVMADSADAALAVLEQHAGIDAVLSDIVMPGRMNGIGLAHEVARRWPQVDIVLATAYAQERVGLAGVETLAKPYRIEDVLLALQRARARRAPPVPVPAV